MSTTMLPPSSNHRPISLRARSDLVISMSVFQGEPSWVVKDPISLKYFRLREPEHEVLQLLRGTCSYDEIRRHLAGRFPNRQFDIRQLQRLLQSFHQNGLLISNASGQAGPLGRRCLEDRKRKLLATLGSIVSIRFPGFDPEPVLAWLYPKTAWMFSRFATFCFLVLITAACLLVGINADEFFARLPDFQTFFGIRNLVYLGFILIVTKTIHEFGHGLMCKHFGGECHEMGFMLMVLTPAMYCDTSDSWVLSNKWHRIAIGAGGMWLELIVASAATFVWWYTNPGWAHYLALNVMFLSSVATVIFNINPLLRYDGYYMLSDLLEIPNLSQKSNQLLLDRVRVWCLGMDASSRSRLPEKYRISFALYSIASFAYRWFVLAMIFWFLTRVFEPYGLEVLGYLVLTVSLTGAVVIPAVRAFRFFLFPGNLRMVKARSLLTTSLVILLVVAAISTLPLPHYVFADFVIRPGEAQSHYVEWPGNLREICVEYGDIVEEGQVIACLENPDLDIAIEELQSELERQTAALRSFRVDETDPLMAARLAGEARAKIAQLSKQLENRKRQQACLQITAVRNGVVIPPPNLIEPARADTDLAAWSDTPLKQENLHALLERQTLVCFVGDASDLTAILAIPEEDLKFVQADQPVELVSNSFRGENLRGRVEFVSNEPLDLLPRELSASNGGAIAAAERMGGGETSLLPMCAASVQFERPLPTNFLPGMIGKAKIQVGSSTVASRVIRAIATVLKFR